MSAAPRQVHLIVITPERQVLERRVLAVVLPAHDGELGVLYDRAPLVCELGIGQLRYTDAAGRARLFIDGGFAQVLDNRVIVLTPRAVPVEQITPEMVTAAEEALAAQRGIDPETWAARERAGQRLRMLRRLRPAG